MRYRAAERDGAAIAHARTADRRALPAYAPELNAVEGAWAHMKNSLGNLALRDVTSPRPGSRSNPSRPNE